MRNIITNHTFKTLKKFTVDINRIRVANRCTIAFFKTGTTAVCSCRNGNSSEGKLRLKYTEEKAQKYLYNP